MARRRVLYALALAGAVLFQICFTGYLSHFTLLLALTLPLLSLALSLPAILFARLRLLPAAPEVERGKEAGWELRGSGGFGLPLARVRVVLAVENRLTGAVERRRLTLSGVSDALAVPADTGHCGRLECRVERVRACDCLGLFSLPLKPPPAASLLVLPVPDPDAVLPELGEGRAGAGVRPRPCGGPGEDYDLRPYRTGDPMRAVHWKLSSKREDDLIVKETLEPRWAALVLTFDHFGPPAEVDAALDRLVALSRALLVRERNHFIQWREPVSGAVRSYAVTGERELSVCLAAALSEPAPGEGKSILDVPLRVAGGDGPVRSLHVTGRGEGSL